MKSLKLVPFNFPRMRVQHPSFLLTPTLPSTPPFPFLAKPPQVNPRNSRMHRAGSILLALHHPTRIHRHFLPMGVHSAPHSYRFCVIWHWRPFYDFLAILAILAIFRFLEI